VEAPAPAEIAEPLPEEKPAKPARGRKPKAATTPETTAESTSEAAEEAKDAAPEVEVVATAEDAERLMGVVQEILDAAELQVSVKVSQLNGRYVNIELDGKDAAHLIGKHGDVLNSMQYLVNIIGSRKLANGVRATLDGNQFRTRREEALRDLATKIAIQVKQRQEEAVLDALPAFERRIVHKALGEIEGITTYSEGEEPNRRVVIAPAD
jgi:spoIIIJ-associated protein